MQKTYRIEVDCANCANLMEEAAKKTPGVKDAAVNFMALRMSVAFEDGADEALVDDDGGAAGLGDEHVADELGGFGFLGGGHGECLLVWRIDGRD